jgi:3-oxoacyl-[acyl-carrier-protein] synthase II
VSRRVVVTGLGLVTPLGCEVDQVWERLLRGEVAVGEPPRPGGARPPTRAAASLDDATRAALARRFPDAARTGDPRTLFGVAAGALAIEDAGLSPGSHPRAGAFVGTGPGIHRLEDVDRRLAGEGGAAPAEDEAAAEPDSLVRNAAERPAALLASRFGLGGPVHAVSTACSASNQAIGMAWRAVRRGEADWAVAGGTDAMLGPVGLVFFVLLGAAAAGDGPPGEACRPFDRRRSGLVVGEGAGFAVLEEVGHARARGARAYAEVRGYGASLDAWRSTAPCPDGRGAAEAMRAALRDGGVAPGAVDYVSAHGTGTKRNDPAEVRAIRTVFGAHADALAVSSVKGALGHLLAGAAGVSFAVAALAVARGAVPPTANLVEPDPACDLDLVPDAGRRRRVRGAINNAFAFGGQNSCLVLVAAGGEAGA